MFHKNKFHWFYLSSRVHHHRPLIVLIVSDYALDENDELEEVDVGKEEEEKIPKKCMMQRIRPSVRYFIKHVINMYTRIKTL